MEPVSTTLLLYLALITSSVASLQGIYGAITSIGFAAPRRLPHAFGAPLLGHALSASINFVAAVSIISYANLPANDNFAHDHHGYPNVLQGPVNDVKADENDASRVDKHVSSHGAMQVRCKDRDFVK